MSVSQISLTEAWSILTDNAQAQLIDVRTTAEWNFVGVPNLDSIGKETRHVEWTRYPDGSANPDFVADASNGLDKDQAVLFVCRSGARSQAAAEAFVAAGFTNVSNVEAGFEGDLDAEGHRHGGWKDELPWRQG